ncbi:hypothetical protein [Nocardia nova]|jgi:hypothetical protein|uniref:hypothetical protein n=1 Tax=Nocardia nova TaxID=37330 RepID=UPI0012E715ED|nr:hypothetical protein [Nocardia nova]
MDARIEAWARRTPSTELACGPTIEELGGPDEIVAQADYFIGGPFLGYLVTAAGKDVNRGLTPALADTIVAGLTNSTRHLAFAEALDSLAAQPGLVRALGGRAVAKALLDRITAAGEATEDPAVALIGADSAECLLQLAMAKVTTAAQLAGKLDEVTEDVAALPKEFAVRLPRLLGALDAHLPGAGMREALERCLPFDHTFRDAAFELALSDIRSALEQHGYQAIISRLSTVRSQLIALAETDPDRLDATIYLAAIDGLLGLSAPDAPERVSNAAAVLHESLQRYHSWRMRTNTPSWSRSRQEDIASWAKLIALLDDAANYMGRDDPWYEHGHGILTALVGAYTAHHTLTVLADAPAQCVVETLVSPVIEDVFLQNENRLRILRYALANDRELRGDPGAQMLDAALVARLDEREASTTSEGVDLGKARRWHQLARQLSHDFPEIVANNDELVLDRLELALRDTDDLAVAAADPKYSRLMRSLVERLERSGDWCAGVAEAFLVLLDVTINFMCFSYEVGRKMGGGYTEYLRLRDKDGKKQKVDEALFHQHYLSFVYGTSLFRIVHSEVIDKAGGRVDILFTFPAAQINVECKIEDKDASRNGLRKYVAQAAEYQNTGPSFAVLLVLDKTVGSEGAVNLFDSVWIEEVQRSDEVEPCLVVVFRIPGSRENPNDLRPGLRPIDA